jgi:transcriptional regulator with XRE-family HTH domain
MIKYAAEEITVIIGDRLRQLRESENQSQGDVEKSTGLLRCYISRVEDGHTVPAVETLEKFARALEVPIYQLFHDGTDVPNSAKARVIGSDDTEWANSGRTAQYFQKLRKCLGKMSPQDRAILLQMTRLMIGRNARSARRAANKPKA